MTHKPRKRFGQHFLRDDYLIQKIIDAIHAQTDDHIVEIGPGHGALTQYLLMQTNQLDVVEIDRDLVQDLEHKFKNYTNLTIHQADILHFDLTSLITNQLPLRIVGNLPYYLSTPLLFKLFPIANHIKDMYFMLQREVVERLTASVGSSDYGRLSVMSQYFCDNEQLFEVSPKAFFPEPNVYSAVLKMVPHQQHTIVAEDYDTFSYIVQEAFSHRRKTLHNALKKIISTEDLLTVSINPQLRPQEITVEEYVRISNLVSVKG